MIDLSYLTEEEQQMILRVLKRDAELKKVEEDRVRDLQKAQDKSKLRFMTGEWFYHAKSQRHSDKIHGSEIIWASLRRQKPRVLAKSTQLETPCTTKNGQKDNLPVLKTAGNREGTASEPHKDRETGTALEDSQKQSPAKQRHNPFNRASLEAFEETESEVTTAVEPLKLAEGGLLLPCMTDDHPQSEPSSTTDETETRLAPVPKRRTKMIWALADASDADESSSLSTDRTGSQSRKSSMGEFSGPSRLLQNNLRDISPTSSVSTAKDRTEDEALQYLLDKKQVRPAALLSLCEPGGSVQPLDWQARSGLQKLRFESAAPPGEQEATVRGSNQSSGSGEATGKRLWVEERSQPPPAHALGPNSTLQSLQSHKARPLEQTPSSVQQHASVTHTWVEAGKEQHSFQVEPLDPLVPSSPTFVYGKNQEVQLVEEPGLLNSRSPTQSRELSEEEGDSIVKVLEWFSRSSDSDDILNTVENLNLNESKEDSKYLSNVASENFHFTTPAGTETQSTMKNEVWLDKAGGTEDLETFPEESPDEVKLSKGELLKLRYLAMHQHSSLNAENAYQPKRRMSAAETKLKTQTDRDGKSQKTNGLDIYDKTTSVDLFLKSDMEVEPNVVQDEKPQKIDNIKSSWEKESAGSKVPVSRPSGDSKTNEAKNTPVYRTELNGINKMTEYLNKMGEEAAQPIRTQVQAENMTSTLNVHIFQMPISDFHNEKKHDNIENSKKAASVQSSVSSGPVDACSGGTATSGDASTVTSTTYGESSQTKQEIKFSAKGVYSVNELQTSQLSPDGKDPDQTGYNARKVGQLKSFWEHENPGPKIVSQSKDRLEMKPNKPVIITMQNTTNTQNGCDLKTNGIELSGDNDRKSAVSPPRQKPNFTVLSMKERMEKAAGQSPANSQFKNLCDFWGGVVSHSSDPQSPTSGDELTSLKSPRSRTPESTGVLQQRKPVSVDIKKFINPNYYPQIQMKDSGKFHAKQVRSEDSNSKALSENIPSFCSTPLDKNHESSREGLGSGTVGTKLTAETKATESQCCSGEAKEVNEVLKLSSAGETGDLQLLITPDDKGILLRSARRTSGSANEKANTVQGTVNLEEMLTQDSPVNAGKKHDGNQNERQFFYKGDKDRKFPGASDDTGNQQPLARSFIPPDYQYYLGTAGTKNVENPAKSEITEWQISTISTPESLDGSHENSTLVNPHVLQTERGNEELPLPQQGTDGHSFGPSRSSTPESRSSSCQESQSPVMTALKRAQARSTSRHMPSSESMMDVANIPPVPTGSSTPSASFADPDQIRKMSKSVPNFLQKESQEGDSDSVSETSYHGSVPRMGSSLTDLSLSSGMASVSSVSGSVVSIYSGDLGTVEVKGTIKFTLNYVQKLKEFHIFIVQCTDLAVADTRKNRSDPYVKSYLLPDKSRMGKRKTSVKKKTLNPTFNEILRSSRWSCLEVESCQLDFSPADMSQLLENTKQYRASTATLASQTLNLSVWHNDTFGRNSFLGEADVDLSTWDFRTTQMYDLPLKPRTTSQLQPTDYRGEMHLAIRFLPEISHTKSAYNTGEVHIWVKECMSLPIIRGTAVDPFVKCFVLPDTSRKSCQKTRVMKRTSRPVFNHTMVYDGFHAGDLQEACVELTVWDHDRLANHFLGGLRLGLGKGKSYGAVVDWMDSNENESALWKRMMDSPNEWVEDTLPLRALTMAKNMLK